jgi:dienelactone hydrolase
MRRGFVVVLIAGLGLLAEAAPARAGYPGCTAQQDAKHHSIGPPSTATHTTVTAPNGKTYEADVFAPDPLPTQRLAAPGAVVMHGIDGNPCGVRWIARALAGRGWFVVSPYRPPTPGPKAERSDKRETLMHVNAERAALAYIQAQDFEYSGLVAPSDIALVGHSLGASAAAWLQSEAPPGVVTIAALDGLRKFGAHDPGLPFNCTGDRHLKITPTVPALGLMSEQVCPGAGDPHDPDDPGSPNLRKTGWAVWRAARIDSLLLVLRGFQHTTYTGSSSDKKLKHVLHYLLPWLNHYQRKQGEAFPDYRKADLSEIYHSAAYLPAQQLFCRNLLVCGP